MIHEILQNIFIELRDNKDIRTLYKFLCELGCDMENISTNVDDYYIPGYYCPMRNESFDIEYEDEVEEHFENGKMTYTIPKLKEYYNLYKNPPISKAKYVKIITAGNKTLLEIEMNKFLAGDKINIIDMQHSSDNDEILILYTLK